MMTTINIVAAVMYLLATLGIGIALTVLFSVCRAFARKQDRLYQQKYEEFYQRNSLS